MDQPVYRNRPTFLGLIVRPKQQVRAALAFVAGTWIVNMSLLGLLLVDMDYLSSANVTLYVVGATLLLNMFSLVAGVILSHRIFGPIISLKRQIASLREGQYSSRLQLRETDELTELKDALNDLAEALEQRHGPGHRSPS